jgi:hypothetical protein
MPKLTLARLLTCLGTISLAAVTLAAGRAVSPLTAVLTQVPNPARGEVIFSNFGPTNHLYEDTAAWDVAGPDGGVQRQWVAMPFTPMLDAEATQIAVAVEHNTGLPNSFVLSLNEDNGGLPGKIIRSWIVSNAPKFGTCCTVDTANDNKGVKVTKGTQYWVVAETNASEEATRMEWDISPQAIEGRFAFNNGQGWYQYTAFTSAFAVYGRSIR